MKKELKIEEPVYLKWVFNHLLDEKLYYLLIPEDSEKQEYKFCCTPEQIMQNRVFDKEEIKKRKKLKKDLIEFDFSKFFKRYVIVSFVNNPGNKLFWPENECQTYLNSFEKIGEAIDFTKMIKTNHIIKIKIYNLVETHVVRI